MIRAKELAEKLGVSPSAVSLALNNKPGVSEETRKKILEGAKNYGLIGFEMPNTTKETILFWVYRKDGIAVHQRNIFDQIFSEIIEGVENQVRELGYLLRIAYMDSSTLLESIARVKEENPVGILLLGTELDEEQMGLFTDLKIPMVMLDNYSQKHDINCVTINNAHGVELAVNYLVECGHENIGYVHVDDNANNFRERFYGFLRSADAHYLALLPSNIIRFISKGGDDVYLELKKHLQKIEMMPSAFFADNDIVAIHLMKILKEMHYRIPEDISIIGHDNIDMARFTDPALTTVRTSKTAIGRCAANLLHSMIRHTTEGVQKIEVKSTLVERKSVKKL